ncbi:NAD-dependent epimerase/dehydratase family protein [Telluria aromaticivorans]|uniref:NAD-dependent epimerase/dehydratase family protein n=1 Tax=Telluria aromaticivorans TaxID=2725995 RepID=A0A7Y2K2S2_9BURK|nr:NAD-dependent epimerase/dehydratase family protein [Telluria aromaticivorans]NNG25491.1 NAD-dependent epimerase/dehydratase family protein [Telluria aromaticivorans]
MRKNILVIGGTRFFGKLLVQRLLRAGHQVTIATRGYAPDPFGDRFGDQFARVRVDRRNEHAMRNAFRHASFDIVYDQMCYSPPDAAISVRVFAGKVGRYVMTSTIDAYRGLAPSDLAFREDALQVQAQAIDSAYPWHDPALAIDSYVAGKVQAEAYLVRDGSLPLATVRLAHVLGGPEDFTGRLAHYVDLVRMRAFLSYTNAAAKVSFMEASGAADFLVWAGAQAFTGAVNAGDDGALSALDLHARVARVLDDVPRAVKVAGPVQPGVLSPFDFVEPLVLDTSRAKALGYRFGHTDEWMEDVIRHHDLAYV